MRTMQGYLREQSEFNALSNIFKNTPVKITHGGSKKVNNVETVFDNILSALYLSGASKEEAIKKADEILKEVDLEGYNNRYPNELSGGQKQRVAIARALINEPDIILADEPTGALDSETTEQVLEIIKNIAAKGKLVIMVTHSEKVAAHSSRIIKILDGEIVDDIQCNELNEAEKKAIEKNLLENSTNIQDNLENVLRLIVKVNLLKEF